MASEGRLGIGIRVGHRGSERKDVICPPRRGPPVVDLSVPGRETVSYLATIYVYYCRNLLREGRLPAALAELEREGVALEALPCGGKIDPVYLLKAFELGAAAVCVITCPVTLCKSMEGSARAARRVELARQLMAEAGLSPDMLALFRPESLESSAINVAADHVAEFVRNFAKSEQGVAR